jgi:uncharacterized protein YbjT (DUF2867 family)
MTSGRSSVAVFGGTGFLGRNIVARLLAKGHSVRVVARRPERATTMFGKPRPELNFRAGDLLVESAVAAAIDGVASVVNAVSLYVERGELTFEAVHVRGAARIARHCAFYGVKRFIQVSGIGADIGSASRYIHARAAGERAARSEFGGTVIVRPAVMFGSDDAFLTTLIRLLRILPVFPLFGNGLTRLQPVYVGDVAEAVAILASRSAPSPIYEFGGPRILRYRELVETVARALSLQRWYVPLPFAVWKVLAVAAQSMLGGGLTQNQVELMQRDNVATAADGFHELGVAATPLEDVLPALVSGRGGRPMLLDR